MTEKVLVPDIGEASDVEVIEILVAEGDTVEADQSLVVLESDKASMEIPAPVAGVVTRLHVALGDGVEEGDLLLELTGEGDGDASANDADESEVEVAATELEPVPEPEPAPVEDTPATEEVVTVAVPDIGEAEEVEVTELLVSVGDTVEADQSLLVLESDKASMEIPSTHAGEVVEILVETGATVDEGDALVRIRTVGSSIAAAPAPAAPQKDSAPVEPASAPQKAAPAQPARTESAKAPDAKAAKVHAGPAVRKEARELGVDLGAVKGSGRNGRILKEDVQQYVKTALSRPAEASGSGIPAVPTVDFSRFGEVEEMAFSRVRKASAKNLHRSWLNVPHVTQFDQADITEMEAFRKQQNQQLAAGGVKLTPLAFLVMAVVKTLKAFPRFNSSLMPEAEGLILKHYYNIGIAVDTDDGLVVPVIKNADQMGLAEIAEACGQLADDARNQRLKMDAMQGASFTISSLGGIGGTAFTPIVNSPEVAILGVSRSEMKPVFNGSEFEPRLMLPLSVSYDHRAIDGAEAARFATHLASMLSDIRRLLV